VEVYCRRASGKENKVTFLTFCFVSAGANDSDSVESFRSDVKKLRGCHFEPLLDLECCAVPRREMRT
jgi:hypothetical protein